MTTRAIVVILLHCFGSVFALSQDCAIIYEEANFRIQEIEVLDNGNLALLGTKGSFNHYVIIDQDGEFIANPNPCGCIGPKVVSILENDLYYFFVYDNGKVYATNHQFEEPFIYKEFRTADDLPMVITSVNRLSNYFAITGHHSKELFPGYTFLLDNQLDTVFTALTPMERAQDIMELNTLEYLITTTNGSGNGVFYLWNIILDSHERIDLEHKFAYDHKLTTDGTSIFSIEGNYLWGDPKEFVFDQLNLKGNLIFEKEFIVDDEWHFVRPHYIQYHKENFYVLTTIRSYGFHFHYILTLGKFGEFTHKFNPSFGHNGVSYYDLNFTKDDRLAIVGWIDSTSTGKLDVGYVALCDNYTSTEVKVEHQNVFYPNPTSGELNSDGEGISRCTLFNIHGQKVKEIPEVNKSLDLTSLTKGFYFIHGYHNGEPFYQRIIIQ